MRRPLFIPVLFFLAGIIAASLLTSRYDLVILSALILLVFVLVKCINKQRSFFVTLGLFFFILGIFRYSSSMSPAGNDISGVISKTPEEVLIYGTVTSDPEWKGARYARYQTFSFAAERILKEEEHAARGTVLVKLFSKKKRPEIGDKLVIGGEIFLPRGKSNPGGFDYRSYLAHRGIRALLSSSEKDHFLKVGISGAPVLLVQRTLFNLREKADHVFKKHLSRPAKAIVRSVTLGLRGEVSDDTSDVFIKTGTMHILAVSGLHTGLVALGLLGLLRVMRCPRNSAYLLAILGIWAFALFSGSRPSSLRAAIMGSFVLTGLLLGRKTDILNALFLSAFLITFFWPGQLFRPGFILSYLAVLSIIFITPVTDAFFNIRPRTRGESKLTAVKRVLLRSLSLSLAVWIGMMPIIAYYFRIITPSVVLANLLAVPALYVMVLTGFGLLAAGSLGFLAPVAVNIAGILNIFIPFFIKTMQVVSMMPLSFVRVPSPNKALTVIFYAVIAMVLLAFRRKNTRAACTGFTKSVPALKEPGTKYPARIALLLLLLLLANLFVWNEISHGPPDSFRVTFFDVGKADASLLEFPDGSTMLIDGGSGGKGTGVDAGRDIIAPYLRQNGIRNIDCVLLTHGHEDHAGGLIYVLENFDVGTVIENKSSLEGNDEQLILKKIHNDVINQKISCFRVERGDLIKGFSGICFYVLNPPIDLYGDANEDSIVVKAVTSNGNSILFCGDVQSGAMKDMLRFGTLLKSDVMKVPHHGMGLGETHIVKDFVKRTDCTIAVIQNRTGKRLNKGLLEAFSEEGARVYVTGDAGALTIKEKERDFTVKSYVNR